jgi:hypothetical protein
VAPGTASAGATPVRQPGQAPQIQPYSPDHQRKFARTLLGRFDADPRPEIAMQQGSLLPFIHDAERYVQDCLGKTGADLIAAARTIVSYDLAMLAFGFRPRLSMHCAAMTAAELLCLSAQLERGGGGPPQEPAASAAQPLSPGQSVPQRSPGAQALEQDADALGALSKSLTQEEVARALADFRQAARERGIDLVVSLALELKGERVKDVARRHLALDSRGTVSPPRQHGGHVAVRSRMPPVIARRAVALAPGS